MHYTPAQTRHFLEAIDRAEVWRAARQRVATCVDARVAQMLDGQVFMKHLRELGARF